MIITIGFLMPIVIYILLWLFRNHPRLSPVFGILGAKASLVVSIFVVIWSCLAFLTAIWSAPQTFSATQIIWKGFVSKGSSLTIGGARENAVVGWSNDSFSPRISAKLSGEKLKLDIRDGGGFVLNVETDKYLNGDVLELNKTPLELKIKDASVNREFAYQLSYKSEWYFWQFLEISANGESLTRIPVKAVRQDKVFPLTALISAYAETLTEKDSKFQALEDLKRRSSGIRLLQRTDGELRLLTEDKPYEGECSSQNCLLTVNWVYSRIPVKIEATKNGNLRYEFLPPYRAASPLPPSEAKNILTVTGQVLPGDFAFLLPLGKAEVMRQTVKIQSDEQGIRLLSGSEPPKQAPTATPVGLKKEPEQPNETSVEGKNLTFLFTVVESFFNWNKLAVWILLAALLYVAGLFLNHKRFEAENGWTIFGLANFVWVILVIRLLLSLRYALEVAYLDKLSVSGIALSLAALCLLPGLVLLAARWANRNPEQLEKSSISWGSLHFLAILILGVAEFYFTAGLWTNLPPSFAPALGLLFGLIWLFLILLGILYFAANIKYPKLPKAVSDKLMEIPYRFFGFWQRPLENLGEKGWSFWIPTSVLSILLILAVGLILLVISGISDFFLGSGNKFVRQVLIPIPFYLLVVFFCFGLKKTVKPVSWKCLLVCGFLVFGILTVALPVGISDFGNAYASLAFLLAIMLVLLVSAIGQKLKNVLRLGLIFLLFFAGLYSVFELFSREILPVSWLPETVQARVLAYKEGQAIQHYLLTAEVGDDTSGLRYRELMYSSQHTWENKAIAHEAGLGGFGFGDAPIRRSQIRLDTIQYDSVFSFYIVGDFGLIGGISLLLIYALPLIMILYGGRGHFDFGYTIVFVIFSLFWFEALFSAAMNFGLLPLTGRSFPLLGVNSFNGDFLRWSILFCIAFTALFWRYDRSGIISDKSVEFVDFDTIQDEPDRGFKAFAVAYTSLKLAVLLLIPSLILLLILITNIRIWLDSELDTPLTLNTLADGVDNLINSKIVKITGSIENPKLYLEENEFDPAVVGDKLDKKLVRQQVDKFNALPPEQRRGENAGFVSLSELQTVSTREKYLELVGRLRGKNIAGESQQPINLFQLEPNDEKDEEENPLPVDLPYRLKFNPKFNMRLSFKEQIQAADVPTVLFSGDNRRIIGAALVNGKWRTVIDPNTNYLSWTDYLAAALNLEWNRLGNAEALKKYGVLTLDKSLQESALKFMDSKGRDLHRTLLQKHAYSNRAEDKLPPRVGLTIMRLGEDSLNGEILALGGFPRVIAGNNWGEKDDLPPARVVENYFSGELQKRFLGDRNFDNGIVMGSSTKPLWAAAVLAIHPNLDKLLQVRGEGPKENDIFGIKIVDDVKPKEFWTVSTTNWTDFRTYLAKSDNRYQVRLGFLGLAKRNGTSVAGIGGSGSGKESLDEKNPKTWGKFPQFPDDIKFSNTQPQAIQNLHQTELAKKMRSYFGAGVVARNNARELDYRQYSYSFWTNNEEDDALRKFNDTDAEPISVEQQRDAFLPVILPAKVNLSLDEVTSPRQFVSILLGGNSNRWSNVQIASAFATCVTGNPILPHITKNSGSPNFYGREKNFTKVNETLALGLNDVIFKGTATEQLKATKALNILESLRKLGYDIFGKTGTLSTDNASAESGGVEPTSRFILVIVKFSDKKQGKIKSGVVFSIFGERAGQHAADGWVGEFINTYANEIMRILGEKPLAVSETQVKPIEKTPNKTSKRKTK